MASGSGSSNGGSPQPGRELLRITETRAVVLRPAAPTYTPVYTPESWRVPVDPTSTYPWAVASGWEWDGCDDPRRILPLLAGWSSPRKLRLLACAIVRHPPFVEDGRSIWELCPSFTWFRMEMPGISHLDCRIAVEGAELRADGGLDDESWAHYRDFGSYVDWRAEGDTFGFDPERYSGSDIRYAAARAITHAFANEGSRLLASMSIYRRWGYHDIGSIHPGHSAAVCRLIDDLHGNPFRPGIVRRDVVTDRAMDLARTIYEDRAYDLMPLLGDALEEAGCPAGEVLRHCRGGGPHARGCWVVDQVLKKEWLPPFRPAARVRDRR